MEEKDPKVTEPTETTEIPGKGPVRRKAARGKPPDAGADAGKGPGSTGREGPGPTGGDVALGPEEIARQLFASYLEPATEEGPDHQESRSAGGPDGAPAEQTAAQLELAPAEEGAEPLAAVELPAGLATEDHEDQEPGAEGEDEELVEGGRHWYVIHSYSGYEGKVKKNLEHRIESLSMHDRIFQVVVPSEEEIELKDGQRRTIERRIFPGYILVEMMMDQDSWGVVRNTPGVTGFVGTRNEPTPLRRQDVDRVLKRMRADTPKVKVSFRPGQKVRVADGPFEDFVGTVDGIYPDKGKVRILVSFFGRETPVELDFLQVEKL